MPINYDSSVITACPSIKNHKSGSKQDLKERKTSGGIPATEFGVLRS